MEYKVAGFNYLESDAPLKAMMDDGWIPLGGVSAVILRGGSQVRFYQAMVRDKAMAAGTVDADTGERVSVGVGS